MSRGEEEIHLPDGRRQPIGSIGSDGKSTPDSPSLEHTFPPEGFNALKEANQHVVEKYKVLQKKCSSLEKQNFSLRNKIQEYSSDESLSPRKMGNDTITARVNNSYPPHVIPSSLVRKGAPIVRASKVVSPSHQPFKLFNREMEHSNSSLNGSLDEMQCNNSQRDGVIAQNSSHSSSDQSSEFISSVKSEVKKWKKFSLKLIKLVPDEKWRELTAISDECLEDLCKFVREEERDDQLYLLLEDVRCVKKPVVWQKASGNLATMTNESEVFYSALPGISLNRNNKVQTASDDEEQDLYTPGGEEEGMKATKGVEDDEEMEDFNMASFLSEIAKYIDHSLTFTDDVKAKLQVLRKDQKQDSRLSDIREKFQVIAIQKSMEKDLVKTNEPHAEENSPPVKYPPEEMRSLFRHDLSKMSVMSDPSQHRPSLYGSIRERPGSAPNSRSVLNSSNQASFTIPDLAEHHSSTRYQEMNRMYMNEVHRRIVPEMPVPARNSKQKHEIDDKFKIQSDGSFVDIDKIEVRGPPAKNASGLYLEGFSQRRKSSEVNHWDTLYNSHLPERIGPESDGRIANRRSAPILDCVRIPENDSYHKNQENYLSKSATIVDGRREQPRTDLSFLRQPPIGSSTLPQTSYADFSSKPRNGKMWHCPVCSKEFDSSIPEVAINSHVNLHFDKEDEKNFEVVDVDHEFNQSGQS